MSAPDRVLVTGASGFVGSAVARKLVGRGYAVRALVRPTSPRFHLAGLDLEFAEGDLRDAATVRPAMAGVRSRASLRGSFLHVEHASRASSTRL